MDRFTTPLDHIRVASPCKADWNQMYGSDRKRLCGECKLNVYNLSDMTRDEAETFLMASEGRVCVRYFRRADGTVLTKNCPVGWRAVKQRISRVATAIFSIVAGFMGGLFAFRAVESAISSIRLASVPPVEMPLESIPHDSLSEPVLKELEYYPVMGEAFIEVEGSVDLSEFRRRSALKKGPSLSIKGDRDFSR